MVYYFLPTVLLFHTIICISTFEKKFETRHFDHQTPKLECLDLGYPPWFPGSSFYVKNLITYNWCYLLEIDKTFSEVHVIGLKSLTSWFLNNSFLSCRETTIKVAVTPIFETNLSLHSRIQDFCICLCLKSLSNFRSSSGSHSYLMMHLLDTI